MKGAAERHRAWIEDAEEWAETPREKAILESRKRTLAALDPRYRVEKLLSASFGSKRSRQNQLVARLKRRRNYAAPVRGGTGAHGYRSVFKHADHDQKTHGSWSRGTSSEQITTATRVAGGATVDVATGETPKSGFMVADPLFSKQIPKGQFTRDVMKQYLRDNYHVLRRKGNYLGTWLDPETGITWLDVASRIDGENYALEFERAVRLGKDRGELAIFDLRTFTTINLNDADSIRAHRLSLKEQSSG